MWVARNVADAALSVRRSTGVIEASVSSPMRLSWAELSMRMPPLAVSTKLGETYVAAALVPMNEPAIVLWWAFGPAIQTLRQAW